MKRINNIFRTLTVLSCLYLIGCTVAEVEDIYSGFPYIEIESEEVNIAKTTQTISVPIKTNRTLRFTSSQEWLKASLSEDGSGLQITASANPLETSRAAVVTITTPNDLVKKTITVSQDASGELTIQGDLILKSHQEILSNTYTKTKSALILGNVSKVTKASENLQCGEYTINVSESDISDESIDTVTNRINEVAGRTLIVAKTKITQLPVGIIAKAGIKKVYLDYNEIGRLMLGIKSMNLTDLSLRGNKLTDISGLADCTTLTYLDISHNDIYTLEHLEGLTNLKTLDVSGLPIPKSQVEVFAESHTGLAWRASDMREEASKLAVIGNVDINLTSATQAALSAKILHNNGGAIKEVGFYIGKDMNVSGMTKHVGTYSAEKNTITLSYDNVKEFTDEMFIRSYVINEIGISYGPKGRLGSTHAYGNVFLSSEMEISTFYHDNYLYVDGTLVVGTPVSSGNSSPEDISITLNDGTSISLKPSEISDISSLSKVLTIRDGLFIGNTKVEDFSVVSHIQSVPSMWLNANRMSTIPSLENIAELKELNLSRNRISDLTPLLGLTDLETLHLGNHEAPDLETNDIGMLNGLEKMTGLRYLDLSGLPIIAKQVKDLKQIMPECTIIFNPADRPAYLPTVKTGGTSRGDGYATLKATLAYNGKTTVTEYGFYIGSDLSAMEKFPVGNSIDDNTEFCYEFHSEEERDFYFYPYAINSIGEGTDTNIRRFNIGRSNLSQYGTSNCYVISESGKYSFNASVKGNSSESVGNIASVEVLWETDQANKKASAGFIISSIELNGQNVMFTTTGREGNALVAVKDMFGTILWSWHIWSTDTPENHTYTSAKSDAFYLMDRNLGATRNDKGAGNEWKESVGTLYQWGRKDPFAQNLYTIASSAFNSVEESVANPTLYSSQTSNSWLKKSDYTLWKDTEKTKYDPCPPGYMVASKDAYACLKPSGSYSYGQDFLYNGTDKAWYPGTPHSDCFGSFMNESGEYAYLWSSSTNNKALAFYYTSSSRSTDSSRSNGDSYPVRCMKEHAINATFTTSGVTNVTKTTATVSGNIEYTGKVKLTEMGFVYSSSTQSPSINSTKVTTSVTEGSFSKTLTGLKAGTTYYICAYIAEGDVVAYGNVISFTTSMGGSTEGLPEEDYEWE